jgi:hypothetical protein
MCRVGTLHLFTQFDLAARVGTRSNHVKHVTRHREQQSDGGHPPQLRRWARICLVSKFTIRTRSCVDNYKTRMHSVDASLRRQCVISQTFHFVSIQSLVGPTSSRSNLKPCCSFGSLCLRPQNAIRNRIIPPTLSMFVAGSFFKPSSASSAVTAREAATTSPSKSKPFSLSSGSG